jgi:signal peptidase II
VALAVFIFDRVAKLLVVNSIPLLDSRPVLGGLLHITHTQNTGAAFSLGLGRGTLFLVFAVVAVVGILYASTRLARGEVWMRIALGMIMGGAVGNATDRLLNGSVTDFLDFRFFPVFNVADSFIVMGAALLALRLERRQAGTG